MHRLARLPALALLLLLPSGGLAAQQLPGDSAIRAMIRERVESGASAGIVVGVIGADGASRVVAYGPQRAGGPPLDAKSVFEIGSVSKVFTASILADMDRRGEVTLDEPVAKLLPASVKVPSRDGRQITLEDLSTQTSGLPRMPDNFHPADPLNPYADYTVQQLYDFLSGYTLTRDIGSKFEYSNLGVGLLGHALSLRAGKSYEQLLKERITQPLGMTSTAVTFTPEMRSHLAVGHGASGQAVSNWDLPTLVGAGGIRSDMEDMLKFLRANMEAPAGSPIGDALALAHEPRREVGPGTMIGLNWFRITPFGDTIVWHNGETGGYHSFIGFEPQKKIGVVVLSNSNSSIDDIALHVLDSRIPLRPPAQPSKHTEITLPPQALDAFVGEYSLAPQFTITVTREGDHLVAQATGQPKFTLYAESPTGFFLKDVDAQITFVRGADGRVTGLVLHQGGNDTPGQKVK